jgi:FkbM family methyltransferase
MLIQGLGASYLSETVSKIDNNDLRAQSNKLLTILFEKIIVMLHPNVFLEIGAREADFSFYMSEILPDTKFICYEANKHSFNAFYSRFEAKRNVEYLNVAISDDVGSVAIKIPKGNRPEILTKGNASLLNRSSYLKGYIEELVNCTTLDESCLSIEPASTICSWIDVEGHFRAVYKGGLATFSRFDALFIEVEDHSFWEGQALTPEVYSLLHDSGLVAIARDRESDLQYNVIFVRENLMGEIKPLVDEFLEKLASLPSPDNI